MDTILIALGVVLAIGFVQVVHRRQQIAGRVNFTKEYMRRYNGFIEKLSGRQGSFDGEDYYWLTQRLDKMQAELGVIGVMDYRPPFANFMFRNYQVLLNTLPEIRAGNAHEHMIAMCYDLMVRHLGVLEEEMHKYSRWLYNPFVWLREGISTIITLPVRIAYWSGLVQYRVVERAASSFIVRLTAFSIALIGLVGSVVTIVLGWDAFLAFLRLWFPWL